MAGRPWTPREIEQLCRRYPDERADDIAQSLGRTVGAIRRMANALQVRKANYDDRLAKHYTVNSRSFHELNPQTAYVLGMIIADGNLRGDKLKITNNSIDVIQACRAALGSDHKVTVPGNPDDHTFSLVIVNKELAEGLRRWGITENKSLTATWPEVPHELFRHTLRGYFDGDGYATYSYRGGLRLKFTSGSPELLATLSQEISRHLGIAPPRIVHDKGRPNALRLWYYGTRASAIGEFMYGEPGFHLARKRLPFEAYADRRGPAT